MTGCEVHGSMRATSTSATPIRVARGVHARHGRFRRIRCVQRAGATVAADRPVPAVMGRAELHVCNKWHRCAPSLAAAAAAGGIAAQAKLYTACVIRDCYSAESAVIRRAEYFAPAAERERSRGGGHVCASRCSRSPRCSASSSGFRGLAMSRSSCSRITTTRQQQKLRRRRLNTRASRTPPLRQHLRAPRNRHRRRRHSRRRRRAAPCRTRARRRPRPRPGAAHDLHRPVRRRRRARAQRARQRPRARLPPPPRRRLRGARLRRARRGGAARSARRLGDDAADAVRTRQLVGGARRRGAAASGAERAVGRVVHPLVDCGAARPFGLQCAQRRRRRGAARRRRASPALGPHLRPLRLVLRLRLRRRAALAAEWRGVRVRRGARRRGGVGAGRGGRPLPAALRRVRRLAGRRRRRRGDAAVPGGLVAPRSSRLLGVLLRSVAPPLGRAHRRHRRGRALAERPRGHGGARCALQRRRRPAAPRR